MKDEVSSQVGVRVAVEGIYQIQIELQLHRLALAAETWRCFEGRLAATGAMAKAGHMLGGLLGCVVATL